MRVAYRSESLLVCLLTGLQKILASVCQFLSASQLKDVFYSVRTFS